MFVLIFLVPLKTLHHIYTHLNVYKCTIEPPKIISRKMTNTKLKNTGVVFEPGVGLFKEDKTSNLENFMGVNIIWDGETIHPDKVDYVELIRMLLKSFKGGEITVLGNISTYSKKVKCFFNTLGIKCITTAGCNNFELNFAMEAFRLSLSNLGESIKTKSKNNPLCFFTTNVNYARVSAMIRRSTLNEDYYQQIYAICKKGSNSDIFNLCFDKVFFLDF